MKLQISREQYTLKKKDLGSELDGQCDSVNKVFIIHKDLKGRQALEALVHELVHGECEESGLRQTPFWTLDKEEILCEIISRSIALNLPVILKFLSKK